MTTTIPSVRREITVKAGRERAFQVFTAGIGTWWPKEHHIGEADLADAVVEPKAGGRVYERGVDGTECDWGQVLHYDPFERFAFSWGIQGDWKFDGDIAKHSEVDVRFIAVDANTTRVELEHKLFERHGEDAEAVAKPVANPHGWGYVLDHYAAAFGG